MNTIRSLMVLLLLSPLLPAQAPPTKPGVEVEMQLAFVSSEEVDTLVCENPKLLKISNKDIVNVEPMTTAEMQKLTFKLIANGENRLIALPKQTVADGRISTVRSGDNHARMTMVTTVDKTDGKSVTKPGLEWIFVGQSIAIRPKVSADKKAVELNLVYTNTTFGEPIVLIPASAKELPKAGEKAKEEGVETNGGLKAVPLNTTGYETRLKLASVKLATSTCMVKEMDLMKVANSDKRQSVLLFMTTKVVEIPVTDPTINDRNNAVNAGKFKDAMRSTTNLVVPYPSVTPYQR